MHTRYVSSAKCSARPSPNRSRGTQYQIKSASRNGVEKHRFVCDLQRTTHAYMHACMAVAVACELHTKNTMYVCYVCYVRLLCMSAMNVCYVRNVCRLCMSAMYVCYVCLPCMSAMSAGKQTSHTCMCRTTAPTVFPYYCYQLLTQALLLGIIISAALHLRLKDECNGLLIVLSNERKERTDRLSAEV